MSTNSCDPNGSGECSNGEESSGGLAEDAWIGIALGIGVGLMCVAWLIRTCTNDIRRQRALHKLRRILCLNKEVHNSSSTLPSRNTANDVIYYSPRGSSSRDTDKDSTDARPVNGNRKSNGSLQSSENVEDTKKDAEETRSVVANGESLPHGVSNASRHHPPGMRKSRSTLSMLSISLAPIEEADDAAPDTNPSHTSHGKKTKTLETNIAPGRSKSYPARLASLSFDMKSHFEKFEDHVNNSFHDETPDENPESAGYYLESPDVSETTESPLGLRADQRVKEAQKSDSEEMEERTKSINVKRL